MIGPDARTPIVLVLGPTASGKTDLALDLVDRLNAEIISVDSAMVYRGMDIGTAKPSPGVLRRAPHALIDIRDPAETYSAADFVVDARREIERIHAAGRLPLLAGGTSLYFRALTDGLAEMPGRDAALRAELSAEARLRGWDRLHARLARLDPTTAARIHPNDAQRIQRMLEIHRITGQPPSRLHARARPTALPWPVLRLVVAPPSREALHERIVRRFGAMMQEGFLTEVEKLYRRPDLDLSQPAMRAVGYRQLWQALDGEFGLDEAVSRAVAASRQLAKRQLTWLRRLDDARWLSGDRAAQSDAATRLIAETFRHAASC